MVRVAVRQIQPFLESTAKKKTDSTGKINVHFVVAGSDYKHSTMRDDINERQ